VEVYLHAFISSVIHECELSASRPGRFTISELPRSMTWRVAPSDPQSSHSAVRVVTLRAVYAFGNVIYI
jgi:hypothetical protein